MGNHWKDLIVWQKSHALVLKIYNLLTSLPRDEKFGLTDQIKRAAVSVPTNIVEGHAKHSTKDFARFLLISRGSLEELRYLLLLSCDLRYVTTETYSALENDCREISILLNNLLKSLQTKP